MPPDPQAKLAPTALDSGLRFQPPQSQTASYGPVLSSNEHKYTTDVYECTTYIYSCLLKLRCVVNCQTFNLSLFNYIDIFRPLYCINSLGPNSAVFESLHKEKHINSTRKKVQSVTQRKIHRKLAQFFKNSTKLCEIYIDH